MEEKEKEALVALIGEFEKLGVDITSEKGRREFRETLQWARTNKIRCDKVSGYVLIILVGGVLAVFGDWLLDGAKNFIKGISK